MKIRPLHDRVVIKRDEQETKTPGGIVLTGRTDDKPSQGKVIAVGNGLVDDTGVLRPMDVKVGDKVLFSQYTGGIVKVDGEELIVMKESEIFAILED